MFIWALISVRCAYIFRLINSRNLSFEGSLLFALQTDRCVRKEAAVTLEWRGSKDIYFQWLK